MPHWAAVLLEGLLAGFAAGVAVTAVAGWVWRDRIRRRLARRRR